MSDASIGHGILFEIKDAGDYVTIGQSAAITPPNLSVDSVDASHTQSPNARREYIPGMVDEGETSQTFLFVPGSAGMALLRSKVRQIVECRETFPNGVKWDFSAFVTDISPDTPIDDKMTNDVTWKLTGESTLSQPAAPVNMIGPAISGVAQVGQTLTAYPGVWSGAPTYGYVWKNAGVAIPGATGKTYVPVVGDVGDAITVTVTATNLTGNANATSPAVSPIAAP